jgi:hypothetical protein
MIGARRTLYMNRMFWKVSDHIATFVTYALEGMEVLVAQHG